MKILGISAFYHDSAAALLIDGKIVAAGQEERWTRIRHDAAFPSEAIRFCLTKSNLKISDLDAVVFYEKPFLKFDRIIDTFMAYAPRGIKAFSYALSEMGHKNIFLRKTLSDELKKIDSKGFEKERLLFSEHHLSHAASAYFPSPFSESTVLTLDGVGEWTTASWGQAKGNILTINEEIKFPHSLGLFYSAFTSICGFKVNSGEYKLMGLAPFGKPRFGETILENLIDVKEDGSFHLNLDYFDFCDTEKMYTQKLLDLLKVQPRAPDGAMDDVYKDIAASAQWALENILLKITRALYQKTKCENLCLAGGVALNCVANSKILNGSGFKNIWIQPAAGDAGGAIGAAFAAYFHHFKMPRVLTSFADGMNGAFLGPEFSDAEIEKVLIDNKAVYHRYDLEQLLPTVASDLAEGMAIGWFNGPMEFGPRSLGARSILADPRDAEMQSKLNLKIKFRESFRPFAPAVLAERVDDWFEIQQKSPYMLLVGKTKLGKSLPSVTHVDQSARVQTVHRETNPAFYSLIEEFERQTGCPVLVNTSFNVRGEPIVCDPLDAYRCFMGTHLDRLVLGTFYLKKSEQKNQLNLNHKNQFKLD